MSRGFGAVGTGEFSALPLNRALLGQGGYDYHLLHATSQFYIPPRAMILQENFVRVMVSMPHSGAFMAFGS